ncbi:MAG TPA: nucleotide exchange factor GrpE, partial [Pseudonocardiaceae bacterium]
MPPEDQPEPDARIKELEDRWLRALAEVENLRKRYERELRREREAERARAVAALLPIVDDIERALAHADADPASVIQGVHAVRDKAVDVLSRLGYPRDDQTGVPFDPNRHEVVAVVDDPGTDPGTVLEVLRPGYGDAQRQ